MPVQTIVQAIRDALRDEMARDERVILMGEDVGRKGGVFLATEGLWAEFGEKRVIDAPLAESGFVGAGIGAAMNGMIPVVEIQFADFIYPAFNQIVSEAARIRYRTAGRVGCPITIRVPYGAGVHGALYHSQSVEAFFAHVPGLKVVAPSTPADTKGLLKAAIRDPDPVLFFEHKKTYRSVKDEVPEGDFLVPLGKADIKRPGTNLTIIAYGAMLHRSLEAAARLAEEGLEAEVIDPRTLVPLDKETIFSSVEKTSKVMIVHEDTRTMGFGAEISAILAEEMFDYLDGPIVRVTGPDSPAVPYNRGLEDAWVPSVDRIVEAARRLAAY